MVFYSCNGHNSSSMVIVGLFGTFSHFYYFRYILSAVDCVLEKIRIDFKINCTDEHKIAALEEFSGTVQIYLGIDPKICDLQITMTTTTSSHTMPTTKPAMTTAVSTDSKTI